MDALTMGSENSAKKRIHYDKLVRDKIPRIIRESGKRCKVRKLSPEEYAEKLVQKLEEELQEFIESRDKEELADMLEVIEAIAKDLGTSWEEIERTRTSKRSNRGGFIRKILLEWVEEDL